MKNNDLKSGADLPVCLRARHGSKRVIPAPQEGRQEGLPHLLMMLWALMLITGCSASTALPDGSPPPDFCLQLYIQSPPKEGFDERFAAIFVIEPDGTLRSATGPGCTLDTYPEPSGELESHQLQQVYNLARAIDYSHTNITIETDAEAIQFCIVVFAEEARRSANLSAPMPEPGTTIEEDPQIRNVKSLTMYLAELTGLESADGYRYER